MRITTLFTALMLLSIVTFASDDITPPKELQNEFNREFAQSTDVKWEKIADYYKVSFVQNGQYLIVYFDVFNNIETISRNINTDMLPMILKKDIKDKVSESSWITDCFEILGENGTEYYVVVEDANQKTIYQAGGNSWDVFKRTEK